MNMKSPVKIEDSLSKRHLKSSSQLHYFLTTKSAALLTYSDDCVVAEQLPEQLVNEDTPYTSSSHEVDMATYSW